MKSLIRSLILTGLSLWVIDVLMEGISFPNTQTLVITALVLGVMNAVVKPILKVLSLPINIMTLGLFSFVINAAILSMTFNLTGGSIDSFWTAVLASILLSIVNSGFETIMGSK